MAYDKVVLTTELQQLATKTDYNALKAFIYFVSRFSPYAPMAMNFLSLKCDLLASVLRSSHLVLHLFFYTGTEPQ